MPSGLPQRSPVQSFLLDPDYWKPRLRELDSIPRHLVVFPRPDLARPGTEVSAIRMRAHDGTRLEALLVRPALGPDSPTVHIRPTSELSCNKLDWEHVNDGQTDLICRLSDQRGLVDRVLDLVRVSQAIRSLESIARAKLRLGRGDREEGDEFVIARLLQEEGWV